MYGFVFKIIVKAMCCSVDLLINVAMTECVCVVGVVDFKVVCVWLHLHAHYCWLVNIGLQL